MKSAIGILIAAGLVGIGYWLYTKSAAGTTTGAPASLGASGGGGLVGKLKNMVANRDATPGGESPFSKNALTKPSDIVATHVARKDAVAPYVLQKFGVPGSIAQPIASVAGKLDVSGYVENYVGGAASSVFKKIGL